MYEIVGVRYCGGCNPRFDRVALVRRLQELLPEVKCVPVQPKQPYAAVIVVCGCPTACAGADDFPSVPVFRIKSPADLAKVLCEWKRLHTQQTG